MGFAAPTRTMTPHIKKKNCKKKLNPPTADFHLNKEEKRKKRRKRKKRKKEETEEDVGCRPTVQAQAWVWVLPAMGLL